MKAVISFNQLLGMDCLPKTRAGWARFRIAVAAVYTKIKESENGEKATKKKKFSKKPKKIEKGSLM